MATSIIFHHPVPIAPGGTSGSSVRPYRMLNAFIELGFEVEEVTGYARQRTRAMRRIKAQAGQGRRFDFVYSEFHTLPTALTEPHHLPTHPFLDHRFLAQMRRAGTPVGVFYRDVNWRFDQFRALYPGLKRYLATWFYWRDWHALHRTADHLFLPTVKMARSLPSPWPKARLSALPPGIAACPPQRLASARDEQRLRLIYVGGVTPPLYDLTPMLDAVGACTFAHLTLCCREQEWEAAKQRYRVPANTRVVHAQGADLQELYAGADAAAILWRWHPYLDFAAPVKLYEALEHGLPVITTPDTETARFVESERVGWTCQSSEAFGALITRLLGSPDLLANAYSRVAEAARGHTWRRRAEQVSATLAEVRA